MNKNVRIRLGVETLKKDTVGTVSAVRSCSVQHMDMLAEAFFVEAKGVYQHEFYSGKEEQYAAELICASRVLEGDEDFRYWSPADTLKGMPGDARVYLLYLPTYTATSLLLNLYDRISEEDREYLAEPIGQAMHACCGRRFAGHGYDADEGFRDAMQIFTSFGVDKLIKKYPDLCREFTELFEQSIKYYRAGNK